MSKHTSGHWYIDGETINAKYQPHRDGICRMFYVEARETELNAEVDANARLIAAAPALLSACESALATCTDLLNHPEPEIIMHDFLSMAVDHLRAVIEDATGK